MMLTLYLFIARDVSDKIQDPKTSTAITFRAGTVTLMKETNGFAEVVVADSYPLARQIPHPPPNPGQATFLKYLPSHV